MKTYKKIGISTLSFSVIFILFFASIALSEGVKKINKEELKTIINNDNVSILDVRQGKDWSSSEFKIKGADRVNPNDFSSWATTYPKENTLVLYCA